MSHKIKYNRIIKIITKYTEERPVPMNKRDKVIAFTNDGAYYGTFVSEFAFRQEVFIHTDMVNLGTLPHTNAAGDEIPDDKIISRVEQLLKFS